MSVWGAVKSGCSKITGANIVRWFWPLPSFGWVSLAFADRLKLVAFFIQAGAGVAMSAFAVWGMYILAQLKAVWPVFYLAAIAMLIIVIVVTGLAGLLIRRSVEAKVGPFSFKTQDSETAKEMMANVPQVTTTTTTTPEGQDNTATTSITPSGSS